MKRKRFFLRTLFMAALLAMPWIMQGQDLAKVSEYEYSVAAAQPYTSIATTGGTCWSEADSANGYTSFTMPFAMSFGQGSIANGSTVYVSKYGYVSTTQPVGTDLPTTGNVIAPLYSSTYTAGRYAVYTSAVPGSDVVTVEWRKLGAGGNVYSFQLKMFPSGQIEFHYGPMTFNGTTSTSPWVGMMASSSDVFAATGSSWSDIALAHATSSTHTLSSTYRPAYDGVASTGMVYTFIQPTCFKPTGFAVGTLTGYTAQLSWTSTAGSSFEVRYSDSPDFNYSAGEGTLVTSATESVTLENLTPLTTYYAYVRSVCDATRKSTWVGPISFTTLCGTFVVSANNPFEEGFEGGVVPPSCWNKTILAAPGSSAPNWQLGTTKHSGSYSAQSKDASSGSSVVMSTPQLEVPANYQLKFWAYRSTSGSSYPLEGIRVWTNNVDNATEGGTQIAYAHRNYTISDENTETPTLSTTGWCEYTVPLPAGTYYVLFEGYQQYGSANYLDDITIEQIPTCFNPTGLALSGLTATSATFGWSPSGHGETNYEILVSDTPVTDFAGKTFTAVNGATTYTAQNLVENTTYYVYLRSNCGANDKSKTVSMTFKTPTAPAVLPYFHDFENAAENLKWQAEGTTATQFVVGSAESSSPSQSLYASNNGGASAAYGTNATAYAVRTIDFTPGKGCNISYKWVGYGETSYDYARVYLAPVAADVTVATKMATGGPAGWLPIDGNTKLNQQTSWQTFSGEFTIPATSDGHYKMVVCFWSDGSNQYAPSFAIDDIRIEEKLFNVTVTEVAATSVTLNIVDDADYSYEYVALDGGAAAPTASTVATALPANKTITGLTGNTDYDLYVRRTTGNTAWVGPLIIHTAYNLPFSENFDSWSAKPDNWSFLSGSYSTTPTATPSTSSWSLNTSYGSYITIEGKALTMNVYSTNRYWAVTPAIEINTDNAFVSVDVAVSGWSSATSNFDANDSFVIAASTDGGTTYTTLLQYSNTELNALSGAYTTLTAMLNGYNGQTVRLAFYAGSESSGSDCRFVFDNIVVEQTPTCFKPTEVAATPTASSAELSWTENGSATQWEVRYWKAGAEADAISVFTDANLYTLNYLDMATSYSFQVRGICSVGDTAEWSDVSSFNTEACLSAVEGDPITIGTQNTTSNSGYNTSYGVPQNTYYYAGISNQIYTATEVGGAATLSSITFTLTSSESKTYNWDIYLMETDKNSFSSNTDWTLPTTAGVYQVYSGSVTTPSGAGSLTIPFSNLFDYSGEHNLMLVVRNPYTQVYSSSTHFAAFTVDGMTNCALSYGDDNYTGSASQSGTRNNVRNVVTFGTVACDKGTCPPPAVAIAPSNDVRGMVALTFTAPDANTTDFGYKVGLQGFDPTTAVESGVASADNNEIALFLQQQTTYDLYVYSRCTGVDNPRMVRYSFTTPFVPDCKVPNTFDTSNVTYTSATISWHQADPHPAKWVLQYGTDATFAENTQVDVTDNPSHTLTDLEPATTYYVRAMSVCDEGVDESPWSTTRESVFSFSTLTCQTPSNVVASDVTNSTAAITWHENGTATSWTLKYGTQDFDPETEGEPISCNETSRVLENLEFLTTYYVYVKSNCTSTVGSDWSNVATFTPGTFVMSYNDSVEITACEGIVYDNGGATGNYANYAEDIMVIYPASEHSYVTLSGNYSTESGYDEITIYSGVGTQGEVLVDAVSGTNSLDVTSVDHRQGALTIKFYSDVSNSGSGFAFELGCTPMPPVFPVSGLATEGVTENVATVKWSDEYNTGATYKVRYGEAAKFNLDDPRTYTDKMAASKSTTLSELMHSTEYTFQVQALKGSDESEWSPLATFRTDCGAWNIDRLPYSEDFAATDSRGLPYCWDTINATTYSSQKSYPQVSSSSLYFYTGYTSSPNHDKCADQYAILPEMGSDVTMRELDVTFKARVYSTAATSYDNHVTVGVMSNPNVDSTFVEVATIPLTSTTNNEYKVELANYAGQGKYIAFKAGKNADTKYNRFYIDDVKVDQRMVYHMLSATDNTTLTLCNESVRMDTVNGGSAVVSANTQVTVVPAEPGMVLNLSGRIDCEYGYDFVSIYEGTGITGRRLYYGTGSATINITDTNKVGSMTILYTSDMDGDNGIGLNLLASCVCPLSVDTVDVPINTCGSYTWDNGMVYPALPVSSVEHAASATFTNVYQENCTTPYRMLTLTQHPSYNFPMETFDICAGETFTYHGKQFTTSVTDTVRFHTENGCDSIYNVTVIRHELPNVAIYVNNRATEALTVCDGSAVALNADVRSTDEATYTWENGTSDQVRNITAANGTSYTLTAVTTANCADSATIVVNTNALPALTVDGPEAICVNGNATLTANAENCDFVWSNEEETQSITVAPTATTTYTVTATDANNCQSTVEHKLVVNALPTGTISAPATICQNDNTVLTIDAEGCTYAWDDATAATTGNVTVAPQTTTTYNVVLTDANGCQKSYSTKVTVNPVYATDDEKSVCFGETFVWGEQVLTESDTYTQTFQTVNGCDSVVTMNFQVQDTAKSNNYLTLCQGSTFAFHGVQYTATESEVIAFDTVSGGGCPAVDYLYVTVNVPTEETVVETACDSYTWTEGDGQTYTTSGDYVYETVNAKGCDSTVTLKLTVNYQNTGIDEQVACNSYKWINNRTYTADNNTATFTLENQWGCDSVVTLNLTVNHNDTVDDIYRSCEREFVWDDGVAYTSSISGVYFLTEDKTMDNCEVYKNLVLTMDNVIDTLVQNIVYCDNYIFDTLDCEGNASEVNLNSDVNGFLYRGMGTDGKKHMYRLNLTISKSKFKNVYAEACDEYTWMLGDTLFSGVYNESGRYQNTITKDGGCYDVYILNLTINKSVIDTVEDVVCEGYNYTNATYGFNDATVPQDGVLMNGPFAGAAANGCDSTFKVFLTVNPTLTKDSVVSACNEYTFNGATYTEVPTAGEEPTLRVVSADPTTGCDSLYTLRLTLGYTTSATDTVYACDSYKWNDSTYTASNTTDTMMLTNAAGCDSIVTLHLTVKNHVTHTDIVTGVCDTYTWIDGNVYTATTNEPTYTVTRSYEEGCDSIVTLDLTVNYSTDSTFTAVACDSYVWNGSTYTASNTTDTMMLKNAANCDSVVTLNLTINYSASSVDTLVACDSTVWNGETYTASNTTDTMMLKTAEDCDSVVTLNLTVNYSRYDTIDYVSNEGYIEYPEGSNIYYNGTDIAPLDTLLAAELTGNLTADNCPIYELPHLVVGTRSYVSVDTVGCDSLVINNVTYTASNMYSQTLTTAQGLDSLVFYNVIIKHSSSSDTTAVVCDSFTWTLNGETYTTTPEVAPTYTLENVEGCDSVITLNLTVNHSNAYTDTQVACDSYEWNGETYTASNTTDTMMLTNAAGCDSVVTLNLTVNYSNAGTETKTVCDSYVWNGETYTASNTTDTAVLTNAAGCDSVVTLNLTVNYSSAYTFTAEACDSYDWNGNTYTASNTTDTMMLTNAANCDSVVTLNLTINYSASSVDTQTVCDSYEWNGKNYTTSNTTDTMMLKTVANCDSVVTLNLTVNYSSAATDIQTACDSYVWNGETYTASNTTDTMMLTNAAGCDSVVTLNLTVNYSTTGTETIVACDSYDWNGTTYTASNTTDTMMLTNAANCDSVVTLNLTVNYGTYQTVLDTAVCDTYTWTLNNDTVITNSGSYMHKYMNAAECPSVDTLMLVVNETAHTADTIITSEGVYYDDQTTALGTYRFGGRVFGTGIYDFADVKVGTTVAGCDSLVSYSLQVYGRVRKDTVVTACESYPYVSVNYDTVFTASTLFTDTLTSSRGYDSVLWIHLTIDTPAYATYVVDRYPLSLGNYTYNDGLGFTSEVVLTGIDYDTVVTEKYYTGNAVNFCDSVVTLELHAVNNNHYDTVHICHSVNEYTWTTSSTAIQHDSTEVLTIPASVEETEDEGFDFVRTMDEGTFNEDIFHIHVIRNAYRYGIERRTVCDSYTWVDGNTYTESTGNNFISFDLPTANDPACDSTAMLFLTVKKSTKDTVVVEACDSYTWMFQPLTGSIDTIGTYTESGLHTVTYTNAANCDSVVTLDLRVNYAKTGDTTVVACDEYKWIDNETYTASATPTYTFTRNYTDGCDSTVTLNLTVNHNTNTAYTQVACDSLRWHDTIFATVTGTYLYNYVTAEGCASTDTLHLTVNKAAHNTVDSTVCDVMLWNGTQYDSTGIYTYGYTAANECPSVDTLRLTVKKSSNNIINDEICLGSTYALNGFEINTLDRTSGVLTEERRETNAVGCDSVITLNLNIKAPSNNYISVTSCSAYEWMLDDEVKIGTFENDTVVTYITVNAQGCDSIMTLDFTRGNENVYKQTIVACNTYTWRHSDGSDETLTESGAYAYRFDADGEGCDNIDSLYLTINNSKSSSFDKSVCDSYVWEGETYTTTGAKTHYYTADNGCDSVVTLNLTVKNSTTSLDVKEACDSYSWNGAEYTETGVYNDTILNAAGCDSVMTLVLTVNKSTENTEIMTVCDNYEWNGETYTESGEYTHNTTNTYGCEQVNILKLTVNNSTTGAYDATVCGNYTWHGETYTESGVYTSTITNAAGCDSVVTLKLTINTPTTGEFSETVCGSYVWAGETYTTSGDRTHTFTGANGCDSVVTLHLTVNNATNGQETVTMCDNYTWFGQNYTTSGVYTHTIANGNANGCDSVVTLNLTINNATHNAITEVACDSYTWHGTQYTTSGTYTYGYNNADGCASKDTLHLTVNASTSASESQAICQGDSYGWNGSTYTTAGTYTYNTVNANGCAHVVTLTLTVNQPATSTVSATACDSYEWNGETYTTSGAKTHTYTAANGCDSVVTLNLTINASTNSTVSQTACDTYTWHNNAYTTSGSYTYTGTNAAGCPDVETLNLTVNHSTSSAESATACDTYTWNQNGQTYTTSGTYNYNGTNSDNCPNTVTLTLTINNSTSANETQTACDSYLWNGTNYTTSGTYNFTGTNAAGCAHVATLNLTINNSAATNSMVSACDSYEWYGETYDATGILTHTAQTVAGCDSVITLFLTVNQSTTATEAAAACDSYEWNGETYEQSGAYTYNTTNAFGCDHVITLNLTVNYSAETNETLVVTNAELPYTYGGQSFNDYGTYDVVLATVAGCDSTIHLTLNHNTDIDATVALDELKLYPNPTRGKVQLSADNVVKVEVLDMVGRKVAVFENTNMFDLSNLAEGTYTLRITLPEGIAVRKVIKK